MRKKRRRSKVAQIPISNEALRILEEPLAFSFIFSFSCFTSLHFLFLFFFSFVSTLLFLIFFFLFLLFVFFSYFQLFSILLFFLFYFFKTINIFYFYFYLLGLFWIKDSILTFYLNHKNQRPQNLFL